MVRDGVPIGAIAVARVEAGPFPDRQLALLKTFADQAVIAIENVRLFTELEAKNRDLSETLEQQTATSEILRVISSSPTDVQPVFDTMGERAEKLCDADVSVVSRFDGELLHLVWLHGMAPEGVEAVRRAFPMRPDDETVSARALRTRAVVHVPDVLADTQYGQKGAARAGGYRGALGVPMVREGQVIGVIFVARTRPGLFADAQVELLKTFADQAVIAVENVRLFAELEAKNRDLTETLEQQTATSEILRVISSSPTDVQPVFDTIAVSALRLCDAKWSAVTRFDGELIELASHHGLTDPAGIVAVERAFPRKPSPHGATDRAIMGRVVGHYPDVLEDRDYQFQDMARAAGYRSMLAVPMVREGQAVGAITVAGATARTFSDRQIELLKTFADQAVIAIENVRLFKELEARNRDFTETLEQQTATGEILRVISGSPTDVQPVFDTIAENARRLCDAEFCAVFRFDGELLHFVAHHGVTAEGVEAWRRRFPVAPDRGSGAGRAVLGAAVEQIPDVDADPDYRFGELARIVTFRSLVAVPILRDGRPIGAITVNRSQAGFLPARQIELLKTFADQAVIAIENVRLFRELEARTHALTRSVGELQALGEVSQAVSSTLDLETVLETIVSRAVQLSGSDGGIVYEFDEGSQSFHARATHSISAAHLEAVRAAPIRLGEGAVGRAGVSREPVQVTDVQEEWRLIPPHVRALHTREGTRSLLAVPLVREERLLGGLVIMRRELAAFSPEVVATLQAFATQSVLAIHNAGLFREIERRKQYADAIVDTSPVAIVTIDLGGRVVGWNPGAERLFGYSEMEALGRRPEDLVATPEVLEEVRANLEKTLEGEWIRAIGRRARKDGTLVDVEISSVPVVVDGAKMGMIGIYHDITDLLRARREAEAANEAKSAFLATMSHEIRTPMNAVIGMSGLLLGTSLTDEQREYAEVVRQSGDTLLTVINDILDFSKIEAGKLELEAQPFDLRECVEGALDLVATRAAEKSLDLAYLLADGTPAAVVGDVTRVRQILLNLLSNAVKFTEHGEVVLSVSARRPDVAAPLHELTFSVRDTGIGIPPDRLGRLFQSFSQVDASTTRRYGGTGLGLAISQRLTELMGGRISVTSEEGRGSEFRVTFLVAAAESARLNPPRPERCPALPPRQACPRGRRQRDEPPYPRRASRRLGDADPRDRLARGCVRVDPGRRALRRRHPRHAHAGDGRRDAGAGHPWASGGDRAATRPLHLARPARGAGRGGGLRRVPPQAHQAVPAVRRAGVRPGRAAGSRGGARRGAGRARPGHGPPPPPPHPPGGGQRREPEGGTADPRADGLPRRRGGERPRSHRRRGAADLRRGPHGRPDAGARRLRGLARAQPALAGRAPPPDRRHDGQRDAGGPGAVRRGRDGRLRGEAHPGGGAGCRARAQLATAGGRRPHRRGGRHRGAELVGRPGSLPPGAGWVHRARPARRPRRVHRQPRPSTGEWSSGSRRRWAGRSSAS